MEQTLCISFVRDLLSQLVRLYDILRIITKTKIKVNSSHCRTYPFIGSGVGAWGSTDTEVTKIRLEVPISVPFGTSE